MTNSELLQIKLKHTASHIMTYAVKMMYSEISLGVGPWTNDGFYQDFDFGEIKISDKDFKKIEKKMRWIINKNFKMVKENISIEEARKKFSKDPFKSKLIEKIISKGEDLSFYSMKNEEGKTVSSDLCAGPHLSFTGELKAFKLTKISASYWEGNSDNPTLTRIYGVSFFSKQELDDYEKFLIEAEKRDHRKLGKELGLFTFSDKVGSGLPLFTPKGTFIRNKIEETIMDIQKDYGYEKVSIPHITKKDLYEISGHWDKYKDDLFHVSGKSNQEFVMKPMNCPHHTQIFDSESRSYKDLPIRYAETTVCYRDEHAGELLGLSRVRALTQDDGHVFCSLDQVKQEMKNIVKVIKRFYTKLEMYEDGNFWVSLSIRDKSNLEKYLGKDENWEKSEIFLKEIAEEESLPYKIIEGEAAFYGPKLDFQFKDAIGREWQLATIQVDFVQPENFKLKYINEKGEKEVPIMIHRAIAGSLERFMSVIIEHFSGAFPAWLSPIQANILPVNTVHEEYAKGLYEKLKNNGLRLKFYDSTDSLGKRIRNSQKSKIPFSIIIGDKEIESGNFTVRKYGEEKDIVVSEEKFYDLCNS
jgi:threonyl-tRNA synthetase